MSGSLQQHSNVDAGLLIGIPTYRRPKELQRLLAALPRVLDEVHRTRSALRVDVLVVDNDPAGSARKVTDSARVACRYVVESTAGVSAVRNRILDEGADYRWLAFIDDDETPARDDWLVALLRTRDATNAQLVAGGVRTVFDGPVDPWIDAGGFFARAHRSHLQTGESIDRAATNNLLVDLEFVRSSGVRFDDRFGRSGGEDSLFTSLLHRGGARMIWCADALVLDHLPVERRTRQHAVSRASGMASAGVRVAVSLAGGAGRRTTVRLRAVGVGFLRVLSGSGRVIVGRVVRSLSLDAVGHRDLARGIGGLAGAFGRVQKHYGEAVNRAPHTEED